MMSKARLSSVRVKPRSMNRVLRARNVSSLVSPLFNEHSGLGGRLVHPLSLFERTVLIVSGRLELFATEDGVAASSQGRPMQRCSTV